MLLAFLAAVYATNTSQAAPWAQAVDPCNGSGLATIIDPADGGGPGAHGRRPPANKHPKRSHFHPAHRLGWRLVIYGYCIDSTEARLTGITVCFVGEISDVRLSYLIAKYPADTQNRINQAARQAAVWHYSNGINLDLADATTGDGSRCGSRQPYTAMLADVNAIDPANPPAILGPGPLAMSVDPASAINQFPLSQVIRSQSPSPRVVCRCRASRCRSRPTSGNSIRRRQQPTPRVKRHSQSAATSPARPTLPRQLSSRAEALEYVVQQEPIAVQPFGIPSSTVETITATASKEWRNAPPPPPGRITLTKNVQGTAIGEQWAFSFTLDGGSLRIATDAAPQVTWEDLVPDRTYILSEADPGSAWTAGYFCLLHKWCTCRRRRCEWLRDPGDGGRRYHLFDHQRQGPASCPVCGRESGMAGCVGFTA